VIVALWLLFCQGLIGAFDTLYYHEWKARLPAGGAETAAELKLHAARDVLYAVLFGTLPLFAWHGLWALGLGCVIAAEIVLTLMDFVVEKEVRKGLGDVYAGERVTHAVMGILYGSMLAFLLPTLFSWWRLPGGFAWAPPEVPVLLRWSLLVMAGGVFLSGMRDLYAALGGRGGGWPWTSWATGPSA
jgi:hypothetical protein